MITLPNGHKLRYVAASGALGFDGKGWPWERPLVWAGLLRPELFTTVIKSLTLKPTEGNLGLTRDGNMKWWNFHRCIRFIRGGAVNRVGLTNGGFRWWVDHISPTIDFERASLVSSMFGPLPEVAQMARQLDRFPFAAHELNVSCPNTGHKSEEAAAVIAAVREIRALVEKPIIVKLGVQQDVVAIARGLNGVVSAISINTVPWELAFGPDQPRQSPLAGLEKKLGTPGKGGVSGIPAQAKNWEAVRLIHSRVPGMPVIGPSVMRYGDVAKVRAAGAAAISFGTCFMRTPWRPTQIVLRDMLAGGDV